MKFRTDFVTNSSSSSFLLEEGYDEERFHRHILQKMEEFRVKAEQYDLSVKEHRIWDEEARYRELAETLPWFEERVQDIGELEGFAFEELVTWYADEIVDGILEKGGLTEAERRMLFCWALLYPICDSRERKDHHDKVTEESAVNTYYEILECESGHGWMRWDEIITVIGEHYEEFQAYCREVAEKGYTYVDLAKEILGCSKCFYDWQADYLAIDAIAEFEGCKYNCRHMG